jgi:hypothetical protein
MPETRRHIHGENRLFELLLRAELVGVTTLALAAVGSTGRETGVALAADHLVAVVLRCESLQRRLNDTTTETEHQVQGGLLLDVVVGESAAVLKLLAGEDQALLIRRDSLLVLNLGLHIVDRVRGLDLKGDGLARQGLHETGFGWSVYWCFEAIGVGGAQAYICTKKEC